MGLLEKLEVFKYFADFQSLSLSLSSPTFVHVCAYEHFAFTCFKREGTYLQISKLTVTVEAVM